MLSTSISFQKGVILIELDARRFLPFFCVCIRDVEEEWVTEVKIFDY